MILLFLSSTLQEKQYLQVEGAAFCWETVTDLQEGLKLFNKDKILEMSRSELSLIISVVVLMI